MSDFFRTDGSVGKTDIDRDMRLAAEFGRKAANSETLQPGIFAGSQRMRYEFKRAILDRYDVRTWPNQDDPAYDVLRLRKALFAAYYGNHVSDAYVNFVSTEIVGFDPPSEIYVNGEEIETDALMMV